MTIQLICTLVSLAVLLLVAVVGIFKGMRRGAFHALTKLVALVLAVVITTVICLCLRGLIADTVQSIAQPFIPTDFAWLGGLIGLIVQIPTSILLLVAFWVIFTVVRLLMLIPEKIVCKFLPKTYEDLICKSEQSSKQAAVTTPLETAAAPEELASSDTEAADTENITANEASDDSNIAEPVHESTAFTEAPLSETVEPTQNIEEETPSRHIAGKIIWKLSAALCGALSSLLVLGAWLMPISGLVTRGGEAVYRVTDTLANENIGEYSDEISMYAKAIASAPLFTVTDFFYGNTVFETLTNFDTDYGKINLSDELENATDIACQTLPVVIHLTEEGDIREGDADLLTAAADQLAESDFLLTVGTFAVNYAGDQMAQPSEGENMTRGKQEFQSALAAVMTEMTPDNLSADIHTLADLIDVLASSPILETILADDKELAPADLIDRPTMRGTFGILYDNEDTKNLLPPLVNYGIEMALTSVGAEPVYSEVNMSLVRRDQMLEEADILCSVAEELVAFSDSLNKENADMATYQLGSAGKALDYFKMSVLFGDQYQPLVKSLTAVVNKDNEGNESLVEALGDALTTAESAEALLNSAQSVVVVNKELESSEVKGRENENLVSSMDTLLNNTSPDDYDSLKNVAGAHFSTASSTVDPETQAQMTEDFINAMTTVSQQEEKDVAAESDAIQVIYDVTHSGSEGAFSKTSEEEAVNALLDSDIAHEMLTTLNEEGRDYGIRSKLSDENKDKIAAAIETNDASADRKAALETFFGLN